MKNAVAALRRCGASLAAALLILSQASPALADGFPGVGSQSDWSDALPYYNVANKNLQEEHYDAAVRRYKEAISHYQYDPDFFVNLGVACRKLGDYAAAEEAFKAAIKLNDKDWMPWSDLANVYLKQDKLQEAVTTFARTLKCAPPAQEKAAIEQDIKDINKILRMQQPPAAATASGAGLPKSGAKTGAAETKVGAKPLAKAGAKAQKTSAESKTNLQGTGWDYVYQGH